jgi:hypothetical protein
MTEEIEGGSTRRDVLKATGAAAVGAAAFFAAANSLGDEAGAVVDSLGVTHIPTSIEMKIDGVVLGKVHNVGPITRAVTVVHTVDAAGVRRVQRGATESSATSVVRTYDGNKTFQQWFSGDSSSGATRAIPRQVTLTLRGRQNSTIGRLDLVNAWPKSWNGPTWHVPLSTAAHSTESVTLVYEEWKLS